VKRDSTTARSLPDEAALRRLLVGVDGSDGAGAAASFAIWLAGTAGAEVTLVHVCPDLRLTAHAPHLGDPAALRGAATHRLAETEEWERRLQNLADYAADGAQVRSRVVRGHPADALLQAARELESDVILVGSTGVGSLRGRLLGSVSSHVVEHARCAVMVFQQGRASSPAHVRSVVIGVDGSPGATAAIAAGRWVATAFDARVVLLAAHESGAALARPTTELRSGVAKEVLARARAAVGVDANVTEELSDGDARRALVDACERHGPSVLVVGTRGLGGFTGLLLGSTSRWVVNHAPCPVLVARNRTEG
jgi:nucleotide-binding universal stress UspA family protein